MWKERDIYATKTDVFDKINNNTIVNSFKQI